MTSFRIVLDRFEDCYVRMHPDDASAFSPHLEINLKLYVGVRSDWTVTRQTIRMDRNFAECLALRQGEQVKLRAAFLSSAEFPICVKPASSDDFEVVEANSELLETILLSQISVVFPGLQFPAFVNRSGKPVNLTVAEGISDAFALVEGSELAIETRARKSPIIESVHNRSFRARVKLGPSEFPVPTIVAHPADVAVLGVGVAQVSGVDFPVLVRSSAALCDPGVVVTGGVLARFLDEGDRVLVQEFSGVPCFARDVLLLSKTATSQDFQRVVEDVGGFMATQEFPIEIDGKFARLKFPGPKDGLFFVDSEVRVSVKALPTQLLPEITEHGRLRDYFDEDVLNEGKVRKVGRSPEECVQALPPSLEDTARTLAFAIDRNLTESDPNLPLVASLVTGLADSGKAEVVRRALELLAPRVPAISVACARLKKREAKEAVSGLFKFAVENPPVVVILEDAENLEFQTRKFLEHLLFEAVRPHRALALIATACTDSAELAEIFAHEVPLPSMTLTDRLALVGSEVCAETEGLSFQQLQRIARGHESFSEILLRGEKRMEPEFLLEHFAGPLTSVAAELRQTVSLPLKFPALCQAAAELPRGALLVGGTGSGKSGLVRALAYDLNLALVTCKGSEVLSKYVGASEEGVREIFAKAASQAPAILFFDEIDALAPTRGSAAGVMDRVVNQLLTMLDGVEAQTSNVFVIAATSRPEVLDPALTRPGRLDCILVCEWPQDYAQLIDILEALSKKFRFVDTLDYVRKVADYVAANCFRVTGADLLGVLSYAQILSQKRGSEIILNEDLETALNRMRVTVTNDHLAAMDQRLMKFRKGKGGFVNAQQVGRKLALQ